MPEIVLEAQLGRAERDPCGQAAAPRRVRSPGPSTATAAEPISVAVGARDLRTPSRATQGPTPCCPCTSGHETYLDPRPGAPAPPGARQPSPTSTS